MKRSSSTVAAVLTLLVAFTFGAAGGQDCNSMIIRNATGDPISELYIVEGYKDDLYEDEGSWGRLENGQAKRYEPLRQGAPHCKWRIWVMWQGYEDSLGYVECTANQKVDLRQCDDITLRYSNDSCSWTCNN